MGLHLLRRLRLTPAAAIGITLALCACDRVPPPTTQPATAPEEAGVSPWFEDVTVKSGVRFVHDAGPTGKYFFPQIAGSGAAVFDFDGDGRLDIYLLQNAGSDSRSTNKLYRQTEHGKFDEVAGSGEAVRRKPDYAHAHQNLGHCLLMQDRLDPAVESFRTAVSCDPNFVDAHVSLAEVLARQGHTEEAMAHLRRATALNPTHGRAKELLGRIGK